MLLCFHILVTLISFCRSWTHPSSTIEIPPICTNCCFAGSPELCVQDWRPHLATSLFTAIWCEMSLDSSRVLRLSSMLSIGCFCWTSSVWDLFASLIGYTLGSRKLPIRSWTCLTACLNTILLIQPLCYKSRSIHGQTTAGIHLTISSRPGPPIPTGPWLQFRLPLLYHI